MPGALASLAAAWMGRWEEALGAWSHFTKLTPPRWCLTKEDEKREMLSGTFAMIRLIDHAVVISLRQVAEMHLGDLPVEIMAHEIGHHVFAPADLRDNARLLTRIRAGLPTREGFAGVVSNLYTDLLINDRLHRQAGLRIDEIYRRLKPPNADRLWNLYSRIYEVLWRLPSGTLASPNLDAQISTDAHLGARVVRAYGKDWLEGAGRFAALLLPYLLELQGDPSGHRIPTWLDADRAGQGDEIPDGLAEVEDAEDDGAIHPAEDPELSGIDEEGEEKEETAEEEPSAPRAGGRATRGGHGTRQRSPQDYAEIMKSLGVKVSPSDLLVRYYRELARPHLIPFPTREVIEAVDPQPEGLDVWDLGQPVGDIDWIGSVVRSPVVIPGVTTLQRSYGTAQGSSPERSPLDLYIGVDCSGSMQNPACFVSYPVIAGAVLALSALRAGARVMVTLSGEPGRYVSTNGFVRDEGEMLGILTSYLGTGYSFGILRLKETFLDDDKRSRPCHVLVITDSDIFHMMNEVQGGWEIGRDAVQAAGGGGTMVLHQSPGMKEFDRLKEYGWDVYSVLSEPGLVVFARNFSRRLYSERTNQ